jgi:hypothetical protein
VAASLRQGCSASRGLLAGESRRAMGGASGGVRGCACRFCRFSSFRRKQNSPRRSRRLHRPRCCLCCRIGGLTPCPTPCGATEDGGGVAVSAAFRVLPPVRRSPFLPILPVVALRWLCSFSDFCRFCRFRRRSHCVPPRRSLSSAVATVTSIARCFCRSCRSCRFPLRAWAALYLPILPVSTCCGEGRRWSLPILPIFAFWTGRWRVRFLPILPIFVIPRRRWCAISADRADVAATAGAPEAEAVAGWRRGARWILRGSFRG